VVNSFDAPARQSFTIEIIDDRRDLLNAIALNSTMFNLARVIGPAVAGFILAAWGAAWCFGLNGASFLAVIGGLLAIRVPAFEPAKTDEPLRQFREGLGYTLRHPVILPLVLITSITCLFSMSYATLMPAFAVVVLHQGETALGFLTAAVGIGAVLGSLFMAAMSRVQGRRGPLLLGGVLFPLSLLAFACSTSYAMSLAFLVAAGFGVVVLNTSINSLIQIHVSDELRGRVMSIYLLSFFGSTPFGALQAGAVAQALGPAMGLAISAGLGLVLVLGVMLASPGLRTDIIAPAETHST